MGAVLQPEETYKSKDNGVSDLLVINEMTFYLFHFHINI